MNAERAVFLFPGQGSQFKGMGADLVREVPSLRSEYYDIADDALGFALSRLCFEGKPEDLRETAVAQPAILLTSLAALAVLRDRGIEPVAVAGHSLGEYTALVASGVLEWTDALRLVRRRGELMSDASVRTPGNMTAVLKLAAEEVRQICTEIAAATNRVVTVANYNSPDQTVISGERTAVEAAAAAARERGANTVALKVSAPFHSSLMAVIEDEFAQALDDVVFAEPSVPVVANATADYVTSGADAKRLLREQLCAPVRWNETIELFVRADVSSFLEVGPGRVLTNISRATAPGVPAHQAGTAAQIVELTGVRTFV